MKAQSGGVHGDYPNLGELEPTRDCPSKSQMKTAACRASGRLVSNKKAQTGEDLLMTGAGSSSERQKTKDAVFLTSRSINLKTVSGKAPKQKNTEISRRV